MQRLFDIFFAVFAIIFLFPLLLIICIVLRFSGEGEIFYVQTRVGRYGKPIKILKFATMLKDSANLLSGTLTLRDDPRILPVGRILRKTKINELPQIFNVLMGDMSIIGPRPQTKECFECFETSAQSKLITVLPGLSGIGSIYFRDEELMMSNASNAKAFYTSHIMRYKGELETWYIDNWSLGLYFKLIFITLRVVITSENPVKVCNFKNIPKAPIELEQYF